MNEGAAKKPTVYNIQAGEAFADRIAAGLLEQGGDDPAALTKTLILLPTRRACRVLRDTFLRLSGGKSLLLPRMQTIGDIDEEELSIEMNATETGNIISALPPAISPLRRKLLLSKLILAKEVDNDINTPDQAMALAEALGRLIDQIHTEGLDIADMDRLVPDNYAVHWEITTKFLKLISEHWPNILKSHGVIDPADRRNRLISALTKHWQENPPEFPVIAAGSTGSIPASGALLATVANLPQGCLILPGLDPLMDEESWQEISDTHPQATLKNLLERMGIERKDVTDWPYGAQQKSDKDIARNWLAAEIMRPAETAGKWMGLKERVDDSRKETIARTLSSVRRFDCDTAQQEAQLIAVLMRDQLEEKGKRVALVTADRNLARRVAMACQRWGINIDDSGGLPLLQSPIGSFLRLAIACAVENARPSVLASLLKSSYFKGGLELTERTRMIGECEAKLLRGPSHRGGFEGLQQRIQDVDQKAAERNRPQDSVSQKCRDFIDMLQQNYNALVSLCDGSKHPFGEFLDAHIILAEALASQPEMTGAELLWRDDAGESAALFLAELRDQAAQIEEVSAADYFAIIEQLMRGINVRSPYGLHPRLAILGQLEARMIQADLVILGGLNEKSWPSEATADPWMSRPMKQDFGLPSPERSIGLAAHDFVQGFCCSNVVLTRAARVDGSPTVPARWLQRLDTVLDALGISKDTLSEPKYTSWADALEHAEDEPQPVKRPEPKPPVALRPDSLSVTSIEKWMRDPYSIYARYILRLFPLDDIEKDADAARRGDIIHSTMERFIAEYKTAMPDNAEEILLQMGREAFEKEIAEPRLWAFWWPRFSRAASWFAGHEKQWRDTATPAATEREGSCELRHSKGIFKLRAKADRIDNMHDGKAAIIDYKTGTSPAKGDIVNGFSPQLPLEAVILQQGGFPGIPAKDTGYMGFWKLSGGREAGKEEAIKADDYAAMTEDAHHGLLALVETFANDDTPYYSLPRPDKAPAFQDYAHLARVQEWAVLGDDDNGSEAA